MRLWGRLTKEQQATVDKFAANEEAKEEIARQFLEAGGERAHASAPSMATPIWDALQAVLTSEERQLALRLAGQDPTYREAFAVEVCKVKKIEVPTVEAAPAVAHTAATRPAPAAITMPAPESGRRFSPPPGPAFNRLLPAQQALVRELYPDARMAEAFAADFMSQQDRITEQRLLGSFGC